MSYNFVLVDVKPYCACQAAGYCPNGSFWPKNLHLQCVLGNPRTGGVRSCNWYCRKKLVLEVERVNKPGNHFLAQDWAMCLVVKGECPVVWVCCVVDPGKSRDSVGVDFSVSRPPSGSPRIGFGV